MIRSLLGAAVLAGAMTIFSTAPAEAQTQALATQNGKCLTVGRDGQSVVVRTCDSRFNVSLQGNVIRVFLGNGTEQCLDGYAGKGSPAEAVGCDGTREQDWYIHPSGQIQNVATNLCLDIEGASRANGARVINWDCNSGSWNQKFAFSEMGAIGGLAGGAAPLPQPANPVTGGASGGGQVIVNNGGNIITHDGGSLIGADGSTLVGQDGASVIGNDAGSLISNTGSNYGIVAAGAGNLIGMDGATIVAAGAGNATGGGYSLQSVSELDFQIRVGSYCLDGSGSTLIVQDCASATRFAITADVIQVIGGNRCVDGYRGRDKIGHEEDQNVRLSVAVLNCDGTAEQSWGLVGHQNNQFLLANRLYPALCMDVDGGVIQPGRSVLLWKCYESARMPHQVFSFALATPAPVPAAAAPVVTATPTASAAVMGQCRDPWVTQSIQEVTGRAPNGSGDSGECYIGNYNGGSWGGYEELKGYVRASLAPSTASIGQRIAIGGYCLDAGASPVTVQDCSRGSRFDLTGGRLQVVGVNTCVDAYRGQYKVGREEDQSAREPANVVGCDGTPEQVWVQHLSSGGSFFLKDSKFGLCMDVDGGVIAPGRTVLLWKCYDAYRPANQIFTVMN